MSICSTPKSPFLTPQKVQLWLPKKSICGSPKSPVVGPQNAPFWVRLGEPNGGAQNAPFWVQGRPRVRHYRPPKFPPNFGFKKWRRKTVKKHDNRARIVCFDTERCENSAENHGKMTKTGPAILSQNAKCRQKNRKSSQNNDNGRKPTRIEPP